MRDKRNLMKLEPESTAEPEFLSRHTTAILAGLSDHPDWSDEQIAAKIGAPIEEVRAERKRMSA